MQKISNEKPRSLAYVVTVEKVSPIDGYTKVECAHVRGWQCVVSKGQLHAGEKAVYFEIDSLLPMNDQRFDFTEKYHRRVKTQKMCGIYSQGVLLPLNMFPEIPPETPVGTDVTAVLGVTYWNPEDNKRKADNPDEPVANKKRRRKHRSKDRFPTCFPYVHKTDETRCENLPQVLGYPESMVVTEKLDGTSATYIAWKNPWYKFWLPKLEFGVYSRNKRVRESEKQSIYWEMEKKYDIRHNLTEFLTANNLHYAALQGECVGSVQGNPLNLKENDLYVFNVITSDKGRLPSLSARREAEFMGMKFVPILSTSYMVPFDMESLKQDADGMSAVNPDVIREGVVVRDFTGSLSFKNVSRKYLLKKGE